MKKLLMLLLALTASICTAFAFSACNLDNLTGKKDGGNSDGGNTPENTEGAYYKAEVKDDGHFIYEPLKDKYKAGTEVEVKLGVITDVSLYVFVNEVRINQSHYDSDYWGYKFTMPEEDITVLITTDAYHGVETCDFSTPFYWVNYCRPENVVKIKCERGYIGVAPDSLAEVVYTTDKANIQNVCGIFNCKLNPYTHEVAPGGYYIYYTFYTADGNQYELHISNGCAVSTSFSTSNRFTIVGFTIPKITGPDSQCKKFNLGSCTVYSDAELKNRIDKHAYISLLEFNECEENTDGKTPSLYVDTRFGILKVIDDRTFIYGDITYKVTGEKDFSIIIY